MWYSLHFVINYVTVIKTWWSFIRRFEVLVPVHIVNELRDQLNIRHMMIVQHVLLTIMLY